jgi:hypothetical protein
MQIGHLRKRLYTLDVKIRTHTMLKRKIAVAVLMGAMALSAIGFQIASALSRSQAAMTGRTVQIAIPVVPPIGPPP